MLNKYLLDYEFTLQYTLEHIGHGHELSDQLMKYFDFSQGNFYGVLPTNANLQRLYVMNSGNIIPQECPKIPTEDDFGNQYIHQLVTSTNKRLKEFITDFLQVNHLNLAVFENILGRTKDPNLEIDQLRLVIINDHIYYLANYLTPLPSLSDALWSAKEVWHTLIVLTKELDSQSLPDTLSQKDLKLICDSTQYIIIGAYDGESYIIWEKHGQTWEYPGFELTEVPKDIVFIEPEQLD